MNKLKTMICAACTLVLTSSSTTLLADSSNFAGPYVGFSAGAYGVEVDGTASSTSIPRESTVQAGAVAGATGLEVGYALPLGSMFLLDVGGSWLGGEAKIAHTADSNSGSQRGPVSFKIDDIVTVYLAPTVILSDTSSVYLKIGMTEADTGVEGDVTTPANLQGETWAIGTRTVLDSGIFIRTEAGFTEYNGISAHGKGSLAGVNNIAVTNAYSAEPTVAYGSISLGLRF